MFVKPKKVISVLLIFAIIFSTIPTINISANKIEPKATNIAQVTIYSTTSIALIQ